MNQEPTKHTRFTVALGLAVSALVSSPPATAEELAPAPSPAVVFVCEHGAAKSVIAASYFNALAERRGLTLRAVARGIAPETRLPPGVVAGLARATLPPATEVPVALAPADLASGARVVTFLPVPQAPSAEQWQVPAVSADFDLARDEIVRRVEALLAELSPKSD